MEDILISIIVPVYNVDKYLDKCLESICNQTYRNIEIVVIDDGSTDNSGEICDKWKQLDNRIKVFHKENGGLSSARNYGLDHCTGKYLGFVDSDDLIEPDMYASLIENMLLYGSEISICQFNRVDEQGKQLESDQSANEEVNCYSHDRIMELLVDDSIITSHACNKLFLSSLWANIRFPVGVLYEDIAIMHEVFNKANTAVVSTQKKYVYLIRSDSTSYRTDTKRDYSLFLAFVGRYHFYKKNFQDNSLIEQCFFKAVVEGIGAVYRMNYYRLEGHENAIKDIQTFYKHNSFKVFNSQLLTMKQKLKVMLISYLFPIYKIGCVLYRKVKGQ